MSVIADSISQTATLPSNRSTSRSTDSSKPRRGEDNTTTTDAAREQDAARFHPSGDVPVGIGGHKKPEEMTEEERKELEHLQKRDREVRAHEQAHLSALGAYSSGGARFSYKSGPDGKRYAVDGEVSVNLSPEKTPEQTIAKAQTIRRAALAPAEPSGADRSVAAEAVQLEAEARKQLAESAQEQPNAATQNEQRSSSPNDVTIASESNVAISSGQPSASPAATAVTRSNFSTSSARYQTNLATCKSCGVAVSEYESHSHVATQG